MNSRHEIMNIKSMTRDALIGSSCTIASSNVSYTFAISDQTSQLQLIRSNAGGEAPKVTASFGGYVPTVSRSLANNLRRMHFGENDEFSMELESRRFLMGFGSGNDIPKVTLDRIADAVKVSCSHFSICDRNGSNVAHVDSSGNLVLRGSVSSVSDAKLKGCVRDMNANVAADLVRNLRPVSFIWTDDGSEDVGLIAQEVEKLCPDLVSDTIGKVKAVKYEKLIPYMLRVLQMLLLSKKN